MATTILFPTSANPKEKMPELIVDAQHPKKRKSTSAEQLSTTETETPNVNKKQRTSADASPAPPAAADDAATTPDDASNADKDKRICHQCRQPVSEFLSCTKMKSKGKKMDRCSFVYCGSCLQRRYAIDMAPVKDDGLPSDPAKRIGHVQTDAYIWSCPSCETKCNCSSHRKSYGLQPTGDVSLYAQEVGKSVAEVLADPEAITAAQDLDKARKAVQAQKNAERTARIEQKKADMEAAKQAKADARAAKQQERVQAKQALTDAQRAERSQKQKEARIRLKEAKDRQEREARGEFVGEKEPRPEFTPGTSNDADAPLKEPKEPKAPKEPKPAKEPKTPKEKTPKQSKLPAGQTQLVIAPNGTPTAPAAAGTKPSTPTAPMIVRPPKPTIRKPRVVQPPEFEFIAISFPLPIIEGRLRIREFVLRFDKIIKLLPKYQRIINDPNGEWSELTYKNLVQAFLSVIQSDDSPPIHPDHVYEAIKEIKGTPADSTQIWITLMNLLDEVIFLPDEQKETPGETEIMRLDLIIWLLELVVQTATIRSQLDADMAKEKQNTHIMHEEHKRLRLAWEDEKAAFNKEKLLLTPENRADFDARYAAANAMHKKLLLRAEAKCWSENRKLNLRTLELGTDTLGNKYHMYHTRELSEEDWGQWICIEKTPHLPHPSGVLPPPPAPTEDIPEPDVDDGTKTWYAVSEPEEILKLANWIRFKGDDEKYQAEMRRWEAEHGIPAASNGIKVEIPQIEREKVDYMPLVDRLKKFAECMGSLMEGKTVV